MGIGGDWYNDVGSHMRITVDPTGGIRGIYVSATGHAAGTYPLVGRYDSAALADHGATLGWTVAWHNGRSDAGSVTSWNGQYYKDGGERICTTWLLTASANPANTWEATAVGQDVFTRDRPPQELIDQRLRRAGSVSHPHTAGRSTPEVDA
ncbi:avidin/streptavidin family protein [Streptomyces sp. NPDC058954]|uniref:avidin/streptavidin family protein n=1 Tax=Streptomyces sp. NPDC058954 TaxID=3346677 RepID=UPI0036CA7908